MEDLLANSYQRVALNGQDSKWAAVNAGVHAIAVLGYLPKLKRGLGLAFGAHFLHDFSIKMFCI